MRSNNEAIAGKKKTNRARVKKSRGGPKKRVYYLERPVNVVWEQPREAKEGGGKREKKKKIVPKKN